MLKSSLIIIFILNFFVKKIEILGSIVVILIILNVCFNKNIVKDLKKLKFLIYVYMITFIVQIYYNQQGEILFKVFNIYITKSGMVNFLSNFFRILNLIMMSWLINTKKNWPKFLKEYQEIFENVMELSPVVFKIIGKRMKLKWFFRHILRQIKIKN